MNYIQNHNRPDGVTSSSGNVEYFGSELVSLCEIGLSRQNRSHIRTAVIFAIAILLITSGIIVSFVLRTQSGIKTEAKHEDANTESALNSIKPSTAEKITLLPNWPSNREMTTQEWIDLVDMAIELQAMSEVEVIKVLRSYVDSCDPILTHAPASKPMLVFRIMFEIPEAYEPVPKVSGLLPYGGLIAAPKNPSDQKQVPMNVSAPIKWSGGLPQLTAYSPPGVIAVFGDLPHPAVEYELLKSTFPFRNDLHEARQALLDN